MLERADIAQRIGTIAAGNGLTRVVRPGNDLSFTDVLRSRLEKESGVTFSMHAMERLNSRGITLGADELNRLSTAMTKAGEKGASDSLVLLGNLAFVVSVENSTVVTAMTGEDMKDHVFTNIDSAVVA